MKAAKILAALAFVLASSALNARTANGVSISHFDVLERVRFVHSDSAAMQKPLPDRPVELSFDALGRNFVLELEPNVALLSAASGAAVPDGVGVYRGRLAGVPGSWARIVVVDGVPRGLVWDGNEMLALESPDDGVAGAAVPVAYRLADMAIAPGAISCGVSGAAANGDSLYKLAVGELELAVQQGPGAVDEITLGAVGDFEFTSAMGSNATAAILTRFNNVDGIFSSELGIQITVATVDTFSDAADPFSDATDTATLLNELGIYRESSPTQSQQGLTHLYTGRDLDGSTVGIAYSGPRSLCDARFGAGLSEGNRGATTDSLIAAHEIGHNFGASHDGDPGGSCPDEPETYIMAPSVNGSEQFSPCSISVMQAQAANASCINPLPGVDVAVRPAGQPAAVLLGNSATVTFDVVNNGTLEATGVTADVSLPGNVTFVSAAASQGSCADGAGTVSCSVGNLAGQGGATVTVSTSTVDSGTAVFTASVSAAVDDNGTNNVASIAVDVDPAVNLVIETPTALTLTLNEGGTVTAVIDNVSTLAATGVTLAIALDDGLRADSASWSIGSCTVTDRQVDCAASGFANQSTSTLSLGVTGLSAGTKGYTLTLASVEVDADTADNTLSGSVRVVDPSASGGGDDGGGGAPGVPLLALLAALALRRRSAIPPEG